MNLSGKTGIKVLFKKFQQSKINNLKLQDEHYQGIPSLQQANHTS